MQATEISSRYAKALFDLATEADTRKKVLTDLRTLQELFKQNQDIPNFFNSAVVKEIEKEQVLKKALDGSGVSDLVENFMLTLAKRSRLSVFDSIVDSYQSTSDDAYGMTRGKVRSATPLSESEQKAIEEKIAEVTGKNVILNYECDPSVIGGLIAEVGGYVFDDTIVTHLRRLKEELKRSLH